MPFYMVWFDLFLALDLKITLWLSEILNNHSEVSIFAVFEADTPNKMDSSTWKSMKMVTFLYVVNFGFGKMWALLDLATIFRADLWGL